MGWYFMWFGPLSYTSKVGGGGVKKCSFPGVLSCGQAKGPISFKIPNKLLRVFMLQSGMGGTRLSPCTRLLSLGEGSYNILPKQISSSFF